MSRTLAIFGTGDVAELAAYYFATDYNRETEVFVVDDDYRHGVQFADRPLIGSSQITSVLDPTNTDVFVALAYTRMNRLRRKKLEWIKSLGFGTTSYVSPRLTSFPNVTHGENCFLLEDNTIQPFVRIGNNVTLWSGNHIGHHSTIEDDVFVASQVVISGGVTVKRGSFLGVNSTLRDHITIGEECVIGAGVTILSDTSDRQVFAANRAVAHERSSDQLKQL